MIMLVSFSQERIFSLQVNQVFVIIMSTIVGSVPTCYVAGQLWDAYEKEKAEGKNPSIPVAGIVLHAALYSGKKV